MVYYVAAMGGIGRITKLAGPFEDKQEAIDMLEPTKKTLPLEFVMFNNVGIYEEKDEADRIMDFLFTDEDE